MKANVSFLNLSTPLTTVPISTIFPYSFSNIQDKFVLPWLNSSIPLRDLEAIFFLPKVVYLDLLTLHLIHIKVILTSFPFPTVRLLSSPFQVIIRIPFSMQWFNEAVPTHIAPDIIVTSSTFSSKHQGAPEKFYPYSSLISSTFPLKIIMLVY